MAVRYLASMLVSALIVGGIGHESEIHWSLVTQIKVYFNAGKKTFISQRA